MLFVVDPGAIGEGIGDVTEKEEPPGTVVRRLMTEARQAALATALAPGAAPGAARDNRGQPDGRDQPYVSLVLVALDSEGSPILLLSDLADHSRNLAVEPRSALLFDGTAGLDNPLTGPRASVLGRLEPVDTADKATESLKTRFLAHHPSAAAYVDFGDFRFYRMAVKSAHLVAGFGRIHWLTAEDVMGGPATGDSG
jgi:heme oxygenase (biliverdin-IX-beta and delta-forming)